MEMREPAGAWKTSSHVVLLNDGTTKSVYAETQQEANERMARHLNRMGSDVAVVDDEPDFDPPKINCCDSAQATGGAYHAPGCGS